MIRAARRLVERTRRRFEERRQRWRWLDGAVRVQQRYGEVHANKLALAIALVCFISLLPLLAVGSAVLGYVAAGSADLPERIVENLGLTGNAAQEVLRAVESAEDSRRAATIVGLVGLLWSGLALVGVLQHAYDRIWQVQDRGWKSRPFALLWLGGATLIFAASVTASTVLDHLPVSDSLNVLGLVVGYATGVALFLWSAQWLPNRDVPYRSLVPGALVGAALFELLKWLGSLVVPWLVERSSATYGTLGVVFAILAWLVLFSRVLLYSAVMNVVAWEQRYGTTELGIEVPALPGVALSGANRSGQAELREPDGRTGSEEPGDDLEVREDRTPVRAGRARSIGQAADESP